MNTTGTDERLIRYLLGRASDEERAAVEERLFTDDAYEEELHATADEVMYDYLAGRLAGPERLFFEERFLAVPRHRERLAFLDGLRAALPRPSRTPSVRWLGPAVAAGTAAALVGGFWLSSRTAVAPGQVAHVAPAPTVTPATPPARPTLAPAPVAAATPAPRSRPADKPRQPAAAAVLAVRLPKTPAAAAIALTAGTERVRMEIDVAAEPPSFDAVLRDKDGVEVWRVAGLAPPAGEPLVLDVPARVLRSQQYALLIEGENLRGGGRPYVVEYSLEISRPGR